ncbi:MAG: CDP-alcohol phosphatidyltransferase family protein [Promethearchaeota archaeon]
MSSIPKLLKLKDYITLVGTTLGIIALACGAIGTRDIISLGFFLISLTLGTDIIDGYIARKTNTVNEIGKELDSLSDSLTFGIAPAVLSFQGFKSGTLYDIVLLIGCICFALGAILRLARFNISDKVGYTGVPTPLSALLIILFFYANYFNALAYGGISIPFSPIAIYSIPFILAAIGWLNITTHISFGEKSKRTYVVIIIIAPLCPIFGIIGLLNIYTIVNMIVSFIFLGSFFGLLGYFMYGFYIKCKTGREKSKDKL